MSTYNGMEYVAEQIQSILVQMNPHDHIFVRDDGSSDQTVAAIENLKDPRISIERGPNIGFAKSFFHLIYHVPADYAMYMLADQDDVWLPQKIERAYDFVAKNSLPFLYCSRLQLVDAGLRPIGLSPDMPKGPCFENAICENIATGCTTAFNAAGMALVREIDFQTLLRAGIHYHDWWLYLNFSRFGKVHWDAAPAILYRQHGANSVGMSQGWRRYWRMWKIVRKKSWINAQVRQAQAFMRLRQTKLSAAESAWLARLYRGSAAKMTWNNFWSLKLIFQRPHMRILFSLLFVHDWLLGRISESPSASPESGQ